VEERFRIAQAVSEAEADAARSALAAAADRLRALLEQRTLLLPAAGTPAPSRAATASEIDRVRAATMRLTCVAGAAGAPGLSAPLLAVGGAPLGLGLVGRPGADAALIGLGERLAAILA
jgi:Asp-tRNA(Asn)/Glu-tRNA(Gln) amidotransferase A subunit family amidase